jgi:hypothetical protein
MNCALLQSGKFLREWLVKDYEEKCLGQMTKLSTVELKEKERNYNECEENQNELTC